MTGSGSAGLDPRRLKVLVVAACALLLAVETTAAFDLYVFLEHPHPFQTSGGRVVPDPSSDVWVLDAVDDWSAEQKQRAHSSCGLASVVAERFEAWSDVEQDCADRELVDGKLVLEKTRHRLLVADPVVGIAFIPRPSRQPSGAKR